jgi:hypothetical protein
MRKLSKAGEAFPKPREGKSKPEGRKTKGDGRKNQGFFFHESTLLNSLRQLLAKNPKNLLSPSYETPRDYVISREPSCHRRDRT